MGAERAPASQASTFSECQEGATEVTSDVPVRDEEVSPPFAPAAPGSLASNPGLADATN